MSKGAQCGSKVNDRGRRSGRGATSAQKPKSRDGTKLIGGHFPREIAKEFKVLAAERELTCQDLLSEALNDLFAKHGRSIRT